VNFPTVFVLNREGVIRSKGVGDSEAYDRAMKTLLEEISAAGPNSGREKRTSLISTV
jgi:hypothetical protein